MHPILAQRQRLALYLIAWIPIAGLLAGLLIFFGSLRWGRSLSFALPMMGMYAFLCLSTWYLCRAFPLGKTGIPRLLAVFAVAAALSSSLWILFGRLWLQILGTLFAEESIASWYAGSAPLLFGVGVLLFLIAVAVHYLIGTFEAAREAEGQSLELKIQAREAELRALKAQIDPHFLFNSLNSISALTSIDPAGARTMCQLLADFLRKSLDVGRRDFISLEEEWGLVSSYLAVEQVRLGSRLVVRREIADSSRNCRVPPLLLQPLVENAVRHGIAQMLQGGEILLASERRGGLLEIRIENPLDPESPAKIKAGIGLANVRRRLYSLYEADAGLELQWDGGSFRAVVRLPATTV